MKKLKDYAQNELKQLSSEQIENTKRPHQVFCVVTEGVTTKNSGVVQARYSEIGYATLHEKRLATVGDLVVYPDGSTDKIISGCSGCLVLNEFPVAINQSVLDNGDVIEESGLLHKDLEITIYEDEPLPEGFLVDHWLSRKVAS
ncbi:hypothetical protein A6M14_07745 [Acinetobacter sp. Ac_877]|uniref:hypothetical protein n=1 Tax=Acinetobacter portensis TaxID=1839785 RepID=UPI00128BC014|nr:hypothetical protein [Acinetobacter portensis]MPW41274.1 hypothetical protein [Acinetobacter portensis]